jgi:signal transduction histidine kinase
MNEIVWALNSNHDNLQSLIAYSRQYAVAYLDDLGIQSQVSIPDAIPNINISGNNRRTIFLLVKEALNNIAKHAQASKVSININIDEKLKISVHDNGRGINLRQNNYGNGLVNMQKRVEGLKGSFELANHDGTNVIFTIPLNSISMRAAG